MVGKIPDSIALKSDINAEPLGNGKDELPMVYGSYNFIAQVVREQEHPFQVTRGAATPLTA